MLSADHRDGMLLGVSAGDIELQMVGDSEKPEIFQEEEAFESSDEESVAMHEVEHEKRVQASRSEEVVSQWQSEMLKKRKKSRMEKIHWVISKIPLVRHPGVLLYGLTLFTLTIIYVVYEFGFPDQKTGDLEVYLVYRTILYSLALLGPIVLLVKLVSTIISRLAQQYVVSDTGPFEASIAIIIWGIVCITTYQIIGEDIFPDDCVLNPDREPTESETLSLTNNCFTPRWAYISAIVSGIGWLVLSLVEEMLLSKMKIRPNKEAIAIALLQEFYLHKLSSFLRHRDVWPKKSDPTNQVPDLDLKVNRLTEVCLLSNLEDRRAELGRFSQTLARQFAIEKSIVRLGGKAFDYLSQSSQTGEITALDFAVVDPEGYQDMFLAFNPKLQDSLTEQDLTSQISNIYFARLKTWDSYADRQSLASLLKMIVGLFYWIFMVVFLLVLAGIGVDNVILPAASFILGFSFAFGSMASLMLQSIILILFIRPFDVGDKVTFGLPGTAPSFLVYRMGLFRTVMFQTNGKFYSIPNSDLLNNKIQNMHKSGAYTFEFTLSVGIDTPPKTLIEFKRAIETYFSDNNEDYNPKNCTIYHDGIVDMNRINIGFWIQLRSVPWHSWGPAQKIRLELMLFLQRTAKHMGITFTQVPQVIRIENNPGLSGPRGSWHANMREEDASSVMGSHASSSHKADRPASSSHLSTGEHLAPLSAYQARRRRKDA